MYRTVYLWCLWLTLGVNALSVAAPLRFAEEGDSQASILALTSPPSRPDTHDGLFTEPAPVAPILGFQYARPGKPICVLASSSFLIPHRQGHLRPPRPVLVPTFSPWRFLHPQKLPPPSAEDDSSLS
jgi:hypothetical protein